MKRTLDDLESGSSPKRHRSEIDGRDEVTTHDNLLNVLINFAPHMDKNEVVIDEDFLRDRYSLVRMEEIPKCTNEKEVISERHQIYENKSPQKQEFTYNSECEKEIHIALPVRRLSIGHKGVTFRGVNVGGSVGLMNDTNAIDRLDETQKEVIMKTIRIEVPPNSVAKLTEHVFEVEKMAKCKMELVIKEKVAIPYFKHGDQWPKGEKMKEIWDYGLKVYGWAKKEERTIAEQRAECVICTFSSDCYFYPKQNEIKIVTDELLGSRLNETDDE